MAETGGQQWIRLGRIRLTYCSARKEIEVHDMDSHEDVATIPVDERGDLESLRCWLDLLCRLEAAR